MKPIISSACISFLVLSLSGCPAAVIGTAGAVGYGAYEANKEDRTVGSVISDASITASVKTKLLKDPFIKGLDINVDTYNGEVVLHGNVDSVALKERALKLTSSVKGVQSIVSKLVVIAEN